MLGRFDSFIQSLPYFLIGPSKAVLIIVISYFIAKIIALTIGLLLQAIFKDKDEKFSHAKRLSALIFWILWLAGILFGLSFIELTETALTLLYSEYGFSKSQVPSFVIILTILMILPKRFDLTPKLQKFAADLNGVPVLKNRFVRRLGLFLFFIFGSYSFYDVYNPISRVNAICILLMIGWLLALIVKEIMQRVWNKPWFIKLGFKAVTAYSLTFVIFVISLPL